MLHRDIIALCIASIVSTMGVRQGTLYPYARGDGPLRISGRLADYEGQLVEGAVVVLYEELIYSWPKPRVLTKIAETTTAADGRFTFEGRTAPGDYFCWLVAHKRGLALAWAMPHYREDVVLCLDRPKPLGGVVVDKTGQPVSGATVRPFLRNEMMMENPLPPLPEPWCTARTDEAGRFAFDSIPADTTADFKIEAPGRAALWTFCDFGLAEGEHYQAGQTDIRITLAPAARIEGQIVDEHTGAPVSGPTVLARLHERPGWYYSRLQAATDPNGHFSLTDLAPGSYQLQIAPADEPEQQWLGTNPVVTVESGQTLDGVRLLANRGALLEVVTTDVNHAPLENVGIHVWCRPFSHKALTDANGLARLRVPAGKCTMSAGKPFYEEITVVRDVVLGKGQTRRESIEIARSDVRVSGIVTDPDARALSGVFIKHGASDWGTIGDSNGRFRYIYYQVPRLPATNTVMARYEPLGLAGIVTLEDPLRSGRFQYDITLTPAYSLSGRVTEPNGAGMSGAHVQLMLAYREWPWQYDGPVAEVLTDAKGAYCIRGIPKPDDDCCWIVVAGVPGYGQNATDPVSLTSPVNEPVALDPIVLLPADQMVSGTVVDADGTPVPHALVETPRAYGEDLRQPRRRVLTDADGRFRIERICKGPVKLNGSTRDSRRGTTHAAGGEENVKIVLGQTLSFARYFKGVRLPLWSELGLPESPSGQEGKAILICLVDIEQRPCRHCLSQVAQRAERLTELGVAVEAVQLSQSTPEEIRNKASEYGVALPLRAITSDPEAIHRALGIRSLPWLVLVDKDRTVRAEDFALADLDHVLETWREP